MRRNWIILGLVITAVAGAAGYQRGSNWKEFHFTGSRLMADLAHPDALIRTASLSKLPRDLLKVPIARDVLTEDLAFYYEQHEDRLGLNGAIKRIAYEHKLDWTDRILVSALNEPAEVALWRDGKGALRHYAIVLRRNTLSKVLQEAASVALKDSQLKRAGEIDSAAGKVAVYALEINPRRTLLLLSQGERIVVLSDPGLLFNGKNQMVPAASAAVTAWLENDGTLARQFALDEVKPEAPATHTFAVGAPTLALGYGDFLSGFKGLRFDFGETWSTSVWLDQKGMPAAGLGDAALWRAAPANPSACVLLPVDWHAAQKVVGEAAKKPQALDAAALAALDGSALACWYGESALYSPVFIMRLAKDLPDRNAALQTLASWAIAPAASDDKATAAKSKSPNDSMIWRGAATKGTQFAAPSVAARGAYVVFSPDGALVDRVLDTIARTLPSVADQMPASNATLALISPRPLSAMAEREVLSALSGAGDANLRAAAQTHLPARMQALATYPPYRLELSGAGKTAGGWQRVEWRTPEERK